MLLAEGTDSYSKGAARLRGQKDARVSLVCKANRVERSLKRIQGKVLAKPEHLSEGK